MEIKHFKNDGKLKLLIIVGTRPEIIRLAAVINKCRQYFDCLLAHTGQNYDYNLNGVFFKDLKLADPDIYMEAVGPSTLRPFDPSTSSGTARLRDRPSTGSGTAGLRDRWPFDKLRDRRLRDRGSGRCYGEYHCQKL